MSEYTLFLDELVYGFPDDVPDQFYSRWLDAYEGEARYNIKKKRVESLLLGAGDTRAVTPTGIALADWLVIVMKVVGSARLDVVAKDSDGVTTINSYLPASGTDNLPGYLTLSTYNITSLTVRGVTAATRVEIFIGTAEEDS